MKNKWICMCAALLVSVRAQAEAKPNVLFIMTDQQSHDMMSCMGNAYLKTPNMDRLAKRGYRFEKTYAANPVCMPSRFSLLTGHQAYDVGVKQNSNQLHDPRKLEEILKSSALGNVFRNAGYETYYSGKVHLYGTRDTTEYGFTFNTANPYQEPALYAEQFLKKWAQEEPAKPFLLFLSFLNPHDICYQAGMDPRYPDKLKPENVDETRRLLALKESLSPEGYLREVPPRPANLEPINGENEEMVRKGHQSRTWSDDEWNLYNWMYHRLTESVDQLIGRVLTSLEESGLEENTIVVFTSDHGDMHGAHNLILKSSMFEEAQRVPFIFAGKGIKAGVADDTTLVCNGLDFLPTICDLADIEIPNGISGISLKPYLTGVGEKPDRTYIVTESFNSMQITDGRYKYTVYEIPENPTLLTDLKTNPEETINYINNPEYESIKATLNRALVENLKSRGLYPVAINRTAKELGAAEKKAVEAARMKRKKKANTSPTGQGT